MKKLEIGDWEPRPYGQKASGVARSGNHAVPFTVRRGHVGSNDTLHYVLAHGWTTGPNSLRVAALAGVEHGHTVYSFDYTNKHWRKALDHNATDVTTIIEALPSSARKAVLAQSMGGAVATVAVARVGNLIERASLVAPGGYLLEEYSSGLQVPRHVLGQTVESLVPRGRFLRTARLLGSGIENCVERLPAVIGEGLELIHGNVHADLLKIKAEPDAPIMHFAYGSHDKIFPAAAQAASVEGLPFDQAWQYDGGHNLIFTDATLANAVLERGILQAAA